MIVMAEIWSTMIVKKYPQPLPSRRSSIPLADDEILCRWYKIVQFFELNKVYPNTQDLVQMWSISKQASLNTLNILDEKDLIILYRDSAGIQMGISGEQLAWGRVAHQKFELEKGIVDGKF